MSRRTSDPSAPSNLLEVLLDAIAERVALRLRAELAPASSVVEYYTKHARPPGTPTWRAAVDTARREGLRCVRIGRALAIERAAWDARFAACSAPTPAAPVVDDVERLRSMGVVLNLPRARKAS